MADDKIINFAAKRAASIAKENRKNNVKVKAVPKNPGLTVNTIKDGKIVQANAKDVDPQATIEVQNPELNRLIEVFSEEKTPANLENLLRELDKSRVLVPAQLNENKVPVPVTISTPDGQVMQPCFTDKSRIPETPKSEAIMNLPIPMLVRLIVTQGRNISALIINPFGKSIVLKKELLERMNEDFNKHAQAMMREQMALESIPGEKEIITNPDGSRTANIKMNEEQYNQFERARFEVVSLPQRFFAEGMEFVEKLVEGKEEFFDKVFEESYENQRMYPFLVDEFKVVTIGATEDVEVIVITMPKRDMVMGNAETIYLVWNKKEEKGNYYAIVQGQTEKDREIVELDKPGHPIRHGAAPAEGLEFSWIMEHALPENKQ